MGIKWENIRVLHSPLTNNIYIGKLNKNGLTTSDKSDDRTNEIQSALAAHLDIWCERNNAEAVEIEFPAGTLIWKRKI
jgi:hypothetical protein